MTSFHNSNLREKEFQSSYQFELRCAGFFLHLFVLHPLFEAIVLFATVTEPSFSSYFDFIAKFISHKIVNVL